MSEGSPSVPGGFGPGSRIAGYLLEEQIGQGGMAVVFRAHDERLDRTVALKILSPALAADEAFRQRFIRESRAAAAVDDPHIIPVFEAGEASGVLFIAMRFVRGGDVRSLVSQFGPLPPGRVAEIISQVASALDAAHGRGLVHRDVKPANMLLDASAGAGRPDHVYLSDFGLSKGSLQASGLTGTGTFLGTLDYISPEQIEGKPVDGRADEYALACAGYELLSGVPPFQREEAMAVMYAQLSEPPPQLTSRRPDLPAAVDAVFARALAKAPGDRYGSCREFSDALREAFGIRPYDSGPGMVPSGEHPATQVVRPQGSGGAPGTQQAGVTPPGMGAVGAGAAGREFGAPTQVAGSAHGSTSPDLTAAHWQGGPGDYGAARRRPWWRSPVALIILIVVLLGGAGAAYVATKGSGGSGDKKNLALPPLTAPTCDSTSAAQARTLSVPSQMSAVNDAKPFGTAVSKDGKHVFVVTETHLDVFTAGANGTLTPVSWGGYLIGNGPPQDATGATLTNNGKYLLVAFWDGFQVLDVRAAEAGAGHINVGTFQVPGVTGQNGTGRAIQVAVTPDDKYAFVSLQYGNEIGVYNLGNAATTGNFSTAAYIGSIKITAPTGVSMSPDGKWLYAASWGTNTLDLISVATATSGTPSKPAVTKPSVSVPAGCQPGRTVFSPDGSIAWVTSEKNNYVLGFVTSRLENGPASKALTAKVMVGQTPIGAGLTANGDRLILADAKGGNLSVVNTSLALARKPGALLGFIKAGQGSHEVAVSPDGQFLYVTNQDSSQIQVVNLSKLP